MNALPLPVALADVLARGDVWRGDTLASLPEATIPSGYPELDAELPGGGWPRGGLSEFLVERSSVGELSLLLPALACLSRADGWLALVAPPWLPHAPAWADERIDARALRRLQVAAEGRPALACLWRGAGVAEQPSPAPLRVALAADEQALAVRILKRRGRPASRSLCLPFSSSLFRPGRSSRVVAGPALSVLADRIPAAAPAA